MLDLYTARCSADLTCIAVVGRAPTTDVADVGRNMLGHVLGRNVAIPDGEKDEIDGQDVPAFTLKRVGRDWRGASLSRTCEPPLSNSP